MLDEVVQFCADSRHSIATSTKKQLIRCCHDVMDMENALWLGLDLLSHERDQLIVR